MSNPTMTRWVEADGSQASKHHQIEVEYVRNPMDINLMCHAMDEVDGVKNAAECKQRPIIRIGEAVTGLGLADHALEITSEFLHTLKPHLRFF